MCTHKHANACTCTCTHKKDIEGTHVHAHVIDMQVTHVHSFMHACTHVCAAHLWNILRPTAAKLNSKCTVEEFRLSQNTWCIIIMTIMCLLLVVNTVQQEQAKSAKKCQQCTINEHTAAAVVLIINWCEHCVGSRWKSQGVCTSHNCRQHEHPKLTFTSVHKNLSRADEEMAYNMSR